MDKKIGGQKVGYSKGFFAINKSINLIIDVGCRLGVYDRGYNPEYHYTLSSFSGKGIRPEDIEKLFGDFVQIDLAQNKDIEGTGLGLAISQSLAKAMGGNISQGDMRKAGEKY